MEDEITIIMNLLSMTGKTIIIISHHAHSLANCDEVYELKDGMLDKIIIKKNLHVKD